MEVEKIKKLLDLYYAGDITPEEHDALCVALAEADQRYPELETEKAVFQALESSEPVMPAGLESRLIEAIDRRSVKRRPWIKVFMAGVAAAVAVMILCVTFLVGSRNTRPEMSDLIAERMISDYDTTELVFTSLEDPSDTTITEEELARRFRIVDHALKDVFSGICVSSRHSSEYMNGINIKQDIKLNLSK